MKDLTNELSKHYKETKELEGGLFAEISMRYSGGSYHIRRDLYTVIDSEVYALSSKDGEPYKNKNSLWDLKRSCHRVGKYDSSKTYGSSYNSISYSEVRKRLGI